jgi:hypothetical protein
MSHEHVVRTLLDQAELLLADVDAEALDPRIVK